MPHAPIYRSVCRDIWYQIDGANGAILERLDPSRRAYRWLYGALHTMDIPVLVAHPVVRSVLIVLSCGFGFVFSITAILISWRRLLVPILCLPVVTANAMIPVSPSDVSHPCIGLTAATRRLASLVMVPSAWKVKREAGAIVFNAGAAPATVSDEPSPVATGDSPEGGDQAATREPGDLPSRTVLWRRRRGGVHRTGGEPDGAFAVGATQQSSRPLAALM